MLRTLLVACAVFVVASLKAITIQWSVTNAQYDWADSVISSGDNPSIGLYFVYSQTKIDSVSDVWSKATTAVSGNGSSGVSVVHNTYSNGSFSTVINGKADTTYKPVLSVDPEKGSHMNGYLRMEGNGFGTAGSGGYYYMVVFNPTTKDSNAQYMVSNAAQYTGDSTTDQANGIYNTTVDPDHMPEYGDYMEIGWMGGTWHAAQTPEPTALALLALGIAGVALRRKS